MDFPASDLSRKGSAAAVAPPTAELPTAELPTDELPTAELPTAELPAAELPAAVLAAAEVAAAEVPGAAAELPAAAEVLPAAADVDAVPFELLLHDAVNSIAVQPAAMAAFDVQRTGVSFPEVLQWW